MSAPGRAVWLDGALVEPGAARVAADDHGLTVGDGVFETVRVVRGRPSLWTRHRERLDRSLVAAGIATPDLDLEAVIATVVEAAGLDDARVRVTVTSGAGPGGLRRGDRPTVLVTAGPVGPPPPPASVAAVPWVRNERGPLAGVKTTSYGEAAALLARAEADGFDDVLVGDTRGRLSEALTANVALALDGRAVTPSTACGCLPGTVRAVLVEAGLVAEAEIPLGALADATEVVLTSAITGIRPVASVDRREVPVVGGPLAEAAAAALAAARSAG